MKNHHMLAAMAVLFIALGVTESTAAQEQQPQQAVKATPTEYEGWRQYMVTCARCHGDDGVAGIMAPDLRHAVTAGGLDSAAFHDVVINGRLPQGMPSLRDVLDEHQIADIYAYLIARATKGLPAGRPDH